jgi:hypothetical protein
MFMDLEKIITINAPVAVMPNAKGSDDTRDASRLTLLLRQENTLARLFKNHVGGFLAAASGGYLPPQEPPPDLRQYG